MASGKQPDLSAFLNPPLCANTDQKVDGKVAPCQNGATLACAGCKLVQYCCKACQKQDWKLHKPICKGRHMSPLYMPRWVQERRVPSFIGNHHMDSAVPGLPHYFWGNIPAIDMLNLKKNEGASVIERDLALLFAASGDLRNVVKTIVGLPEDYRGNCTVVINDKNFFIATRNAILLLTALYFEPKTAVPIMMHLWYSALLPSAVVLALQQCLLPRIKKVCEAIKRVPKDAVHAEMFQIGSSAVNIILQKNEWDLLEDFFKVPDNLTPYNAMQIRQSAIMKEGREDFVDRALYKMSPGRRTGAWKFRAEGILLPYGCSRMSYGETPNPTLYMVPGVWPIDDVADPLDGWAYDEYIKHAPTAKNDVYGAFFFFLRDTLLQFCKRVRNSKIAFHLFAVDAVGIRTHFDSQGLHDTLFDRIEVSNVCDRGYLGPESTLRIFSPMLKPKSQNPNATLLMLFLNAVKEEEHIYTSIRGRSIQDADTRDRMSQLSKYLDIDNHIQNSLFAGPLLGHNPMTSPQIILVMSSLSHFGDFDFYFEKFLSSTSLYDVARDYGVRVKGKNKHSIIEPWPYRVKDTTTKEEFKRMMEESTCGLERYMEFEKAS